MPLATCTLLWKWRIIEGFVQSGRPHRTNIVHQNESLKNVTIKNLVHWCVVFDKGTCAIRPTNYKELFWKMSGLMEYIYTCCQAPAK